MSSITHTSITRAASAASQADHVGTGRLACTELTKSNQRESLSRIQASNGVASQADHEGTGRLSYTDFKEVLKNTGLGLTRKDINLILSQVCLPRMCVPACMHMHVFVLCMRVCLGCVCLLVCTCTCVFYACVSA